ncbi:MAG TPA: hypothetical protein VIJ94_09855 [Caulobacteraceae bacterium]
MSDAAPLDWDRLDAWKYRDEAEATADLLAHVPLTSEDRATVRAEAEGNRLGRSESEN